MFIKPSEDVGALDEATLH